MHVSLVGCGVRDLDVFVPRIARDIDIRDPPPPPPPPDRMDAQMPPLEVSGDATGPDFPDPGKTPSDAGEEDEDASADDGGEMSCAEGQYMGVLECTFEVSRVTLRGPIEFTVGSEIGDAGLPRVTGQLTLNGGGVEVDGDLIGTYDCQEGAVLLESPPLGDAVLGFLSGNRPVRLKATYHGDTDSFGGDVSLPGIGSNCDGTLSADHGETD